MPLPVLHRWNSRRLRIARRIADTTRNLADAGFAFLFFIVFPGRALMRMSMMAVRMGRTRPIKP